MRTIFILFMVCLFMPKGGICFDGAKINKQFIEHKKAKEKEAAENAIVKANGEKLLTMPLPNYDSEDKFIKVQFEELNNSLKISNKTSEFITVVSISTYYNSKINTIKEANIELPPESYDIKGVHKNSLFSYEMEKSREFKFKNFEEVMAGSTQFGFAIKLKINGVENKFYKLNVYKNRDLYKSKLTD